MKRGAFVQFFRQIPWICQGSCQCPSITLPQYHDIFTTTQFPEDLPTCHWNKGFPIQQFAPLLPFLMTLISLSHNLSRECWDSRFRVAYTCWCNKKKKKRERERQKAKVDGNIWKTKIILLHVETFTESFPSSTWDKFLGQQRLWTPKPSWCSLNTCNSSTDGNRRQKVEHSNSLYNLESKFY